MVSKICEIRYILESQKNVSLLLFSYKTGPLSSIPAISKATPNGRDITSSLCWSSPKRRAKSQIDWVQLSTGIGSS